MIKSITQSIVVFAVLTLAVACGPDYKAEVDRMMHERDSLLSCFDAKDSTINGYMADIMNIQMSLDSLTMQEEMLRKSDGNDPEATADMKSRFQNSMQAIRSMIADNKSKLATLQSRIKKSNIKIAELENLINGLNMQIAEKDSNLLAMNEKVTVLNGTITTMQGSMDTMKMDIASKVTEISEKTTKLHTAYYTIGTYKQLRDKKILAKQGGFLGLGKSKSMVPDFNKDGFTQIDYTATNSIAIDTKNAKLVSTHPTGSYTLTRENNVIKGIQITDPENFWKASKYLVVVTD
jgi:predicted  nucleic acid-binding Zn-ribbon protein